jgi:hypothetical protein
MQISFLPAGPIAHIDRLLTRAARIGNNAMRDPSRARKQAVDISLLDRERINEPGLQKP